MSCDLKKIKTNQIRRYRLRRYLRQRDVSKLLRIKHNTDLYRWETGHQLPTLINALKLSAALKCPVELLFSDHFKQIQLDMYGERMEMTTTAL
ncbi:MAG: helix-turn-helix domain-containing protein [Candidatus Zixiibacteriota bacterium]